MGRASQRVRVQSRTYGSLATTHRRTHDNLNVLSIYLFFVVLQAMPPLGRTLSFSTTTCTDPSLSPSPAACDPTHKQVPCVPYVRRRNTPAQLRDLERAFEVTEHPSREQRQSLADELRL